MAVDVVVLPARRDRADVGVVGRGAHDRTVAIGSTPGTAGRERGRRVPSPGPVRVGEGSPSLREASARGRRTTVLGAMHAASLAPAPGTVPRSGWRPPAPR